MIQYKLRIFPIFVVTQTYQAFSPHFAPLIYQSHNNACKYARLFPVSNVNDGAGELEQLFSDECDIFVRSGMGGLGALSSVGTRPAGGSGGKGGDVYIECSSNYNDLSHLSGSKFHAAGGKDAKQRQTGLNGRDCVVFVPPHCAVTRQKTNETLRTLVNHGDRYIVCRGGAGGLGNGKSGIRDKCTPPGSAQKGWLSLQMTLVADVGLVGYPNVGKSSLLRTVTKARPKVASYPFTTLVPNLGVCDCGRFSLDPSMAMIWLDIPGVIQGAAAGKGLGRAFLRHTERCQILLHMVDGASPDPVADFHAINRELSLYSSILAEKPQAVVLTKTDTMADEVIDEKLKLLKESAGHGRVMGISSTHNTKLRELLERTYKFLQLHNQRKAVHTSHKATEPGSQ